MKQKWLVLLADVALLTLVLLAPSLSQWMLDQWEDCPVAEMGWLCPSCGGTRCVQALSQGHIGQALQSNWYVCLLLVYGCIWMGMVNLAALFRIEWAKRMATWMCKPWILATLFSGFALFGVLRNVF